MQWAKNTHRFTGHNVESPTFISVFLLLSSIFLLPQDIYSFFSYVITVPVWFSKSICLLLFIPSRHLIMFIIITEFQENRQGGEEKNPKTHFHVFHCIQRYA